MSYMYLRALAAQQSYKTLKVACLKQNDQLNDKIWSWCLQNFVECLQHAGNAGTL